MQIELKEKSVQSFLWVLKYCRLMVCVQILERYVALDYQNMHESHMID